MKKIIVITGGSDGLGKELTKIYSSKSDYTVVVVSNDEDSLNTTMTEYKCKGLLCDVSNFKQVESTVSTIMKKLGRIDVLVNCAGIYIEGPLDSYSYEKMHKVVEVNTMGTMFFCRAVLPILKALKGGKILNVVSRAGLVPRALKTVYHASKWAITGFTDSLWEELRGEKISVMGLYPGLIDTKFKAKAGIEANMKGAMSVSEVAKVAEFMLSFDNMVFQKVAISSINEQ